MDSTRQCLKCRSNDLIRIPYSSSSELSVPEGNASWHSVSVTSYVCGNCGYVEEWVENKADLEKLRKAYGQQG